jgi:hypothetical protein
LELCFHAQSHLESFLAVGVLLGSLDSEELVERAKFLGGSHPTKLPLELEEASIVKECC